MYQRASMHNMAKVMAATAALSPVANVFLGGQAMAANHFPFISSVGTEVNNLPGLTPGDPHKQIGPSVFYEEDFPRDEHVSVGMTSTRKLHGKPDPKSVIALDIEVTRPRLQKVKGYVKPFVSIDFLKTSDGKWSVHEQQAVPGRPNTTLNIEEIAGESADVQTMTISGNHTNIVTRLLGKKCAARYILTSIEADAYNTMFSIVPHDPVELHDLEGYADIAHIGCDETTYLPDAG